MRLKTVRCKRTAMAKALVVASTLAVAALTDHVMPANALVFAPGDAVLVMYGNDNQAYVNLGSWNTVKNGTSTNVSNLLSQIGGANPIEYTIVANFSPNTVPMVFGSNVDISQWTTLQQNQILPITFDTNLSSWRGQLTNANDPTRSIYAKADPLLSFSTYLDPGGTDTFNGSIPGSRRGSTDINSVLFLLEKTNPLAGITTAMLTSQGQFTLGAVPIPAAAVLFATGLIGLIGIARRSKDFTI